MSDAQSFSGVYKPDPETRGLEKSIRALFVAILARALKDIFRSTYSDHEIYKSQALHWISVDDPDSITSFTSICSYLDIDADKIRQKVLVEVSRKDCDMLRQVQFNPGNHKERSERPRRRSAESIGTHPCW